MNYELIRKNHNRIIRFAFQAMISSKFTGIEIAKMTNQRNADVSTFTTKTASYPVDKCLKIMSLCTENSKGVFVFNYEKKTFKITLPSMNKEFTFEQMIDVIKKHELD